jgi:PAS domain S-box-containing protein
MNYHKMDKAELIKELKKLRAQLDSLQRDGFGRAEDVPMALQESEERFRTVLDSVTDGILLADAETQDFFMANKTICEMLGYSQEEVRELHVDDIHPREDLPRVRETFARQRAKELKLASDIPVRRKDGSIFFADINSAPVTIGGREYVVGVFRDITEHKEAEKARRELEAEKMVVEKMKELDRMKDEFISTVTHELRTPMTPLRSTIEMLLDGSLGEVTSQQRKFVEMMARNVERLAQFTTEVLTLSRLESGRYKLAPKNLALMEVVRPVMELMGTRAASRDSSISLDIPTELLVYADEDSLGMVITNLTNNAIVHTPEGTNITVSARRLEDGLAEIAISDTGEGIAPEHLENLFDRFYQGQRRKSATYKGTGIGLAVCKALVEAMGGEISVESKVGKGTAFRFTVPAQSDNVGGEE